MTIGLSMFEPDHLEGICELQDLLWGGGAQANSAYFGWKYQLNPYLEPIHVVLAMDNGRPVGMLGAFGALWETADGQTLLIPCLSDTVIAPSLRSTALFMSMLGRLVEDLRAGGHATLLDFGDQPSAAAMRLRGWKLVDRWAIATRPNGAGLAGRSRATDLDIDLEPEPNLAELAALARAVPFAGAIRHVRDTGYFRWRHANPLARYRYLVARRAGEAQGYLLLHRPKGRWAMNAPTVLADSAAADDETWTRLLAHASALCGDEHLQVPARNLSPIRQAALEASGFAVQHPTGYITRDIDLPHLLLREILPANQPVGLSQSSTWDLSATCGRSWR